MYKRVLAAVCLVLFASFGGYSAVKMVSLIDKSKCIGCGTCIKNCPVKAITKVIVDGKVKSVVDPTKCIGCGTCVKGCPVKAIALKPADAPAAAPAAKTDTKADPKAAAPKADPAPASSGK